jgi:hypothetical protein
MWYEYVIFVGGCAIIGYLLYRQIRTTMYNTLLTKKMSGQDITGFPHFRDIENQIIDMSKEIITNYEKYKTRKAKKNNKEDNMFQ